MSIFLTYKFLCFFTCYSGNKSLMRQKTIQKIEIEYSMAFCIRNGMKNSFAVAHNNHYKWDTLNLLRFDTPSKLIASYFSSRMNTAFIYLRRYMN